MVSGTNHPCARQLRAILSVGRVGDLTDGQLLHRFLSTSGDSAELAFRALIERHGPMVLRVCRHALADAHDAEDAFQATFLILVRKAGTVRKRASLSSWLHGVALRVCSDARASIARRRKHERCRAEAADREVGPEDTPTDLGRAVREEVDRLPERFRAAVVLCHLEGLTHEEAASRLGWPVGTVRSRLSRARDRLRGSLERRGLASSFAAMGASSIGLPGSIPEALAESTMECAIVGMVPARITHLIKGGLRRMSLGKLKTHGAAALAVGIVTAAVASGALAPPRPEDPPRPIALSSPAPGDLAPLPTRGEVSDALKRWWEGMATLRFRELSAKAGPDGGLPGHPPYRFMDYAHAPKDRFANLTGSINAQGDEAFDRERLFDGKKQVDITTDRKDPPTIQSIRTYDQTATRDRYEGEHSFVTMLFMPVEPRPQVARPLYTCIDGENELRIDRDPAGKPRVVLKVMLGGQAITYDLDPEHGYLPRQVLVDFKIVVTKFAKIDGFWFPIEGTLDLNGLARPEKDAQGRPNKPISMAFKVVDLEINRPIPDDRFTLDPVLSKLAGDRRRKPKANRKPATPKASSPVRQ